MEDCRERNFGSESGVYVTREVYFAPEGSLASFFDSQGPECKLKTLQINYLVQIDWQ